MKIKKMYDTLAPEGKIVNTKSTSTQDTYSCAAIVDIIYPVGSIYMSVNNVNPSVLFGGTWEAWGAGRVPVGVNTSETEFNSVEKTGGEKTHTLSVNEMPSHNHTGSTGTGYTNSLRMVWGTMVDRQDGNHIGSSGDGGIKDLQNTGNFPGANHAHNFTTNNTGGNQPHNNLQPYITCYMWKRTA